MSREVPTTRYFAVGFFTGKQLEQKHRDMLARAAASSAPVPAQNNYIETVHITVFHADTGTETVEMGFNDVATYIQDSAMKADGAHFVMERFSESFPPKRQDSTSGVCRLSQKRRRRFDFWRSSSRAFVFDGHQRS
jgi:hypothetical protein